MIVVMKPGSTQQQIDHVVQLIEDLGLRSHIIQGTDRTVVAALGEKRDGAKQALETGDGVEKVMPILAPYKMASTEVKKDPTCVEVLKLKVGAGKIGVIAGPCSVENREQILQVAHAVREAGATGLRWISSLRWYMTNCAGLRSAICAGSGRDTLYSLLPWFTRPTCTLPVRAKDCSSTIAPISSPCALKSCAIRWWTMRARTLARSAGEVRFA